MRLTEFQEELLEIMKLSNIKVVVSTRKRNKVKADRKSTDKDKSAKAAKVFREQYNYYGPITRKDMGKELWNEYQKMRYKLRKSTN